VDNESSQLVLYVVKALTGAVNGDTSHTVASEELVNPRCVGDDLAVIIELRELDDREDHSSTIAGIGKVLVGDLGGVPELIAEREDEGVVELRKALRSHTIGHVQINILDLHGYNRGETLLFIKHISPRTHR